MARRTNLQQLGVDFVLARRKAQEAEALAKEAQRLLMEAMTTSQVVVDLGGGDLAQITLVEPVRYTWIPDQVKAILPTKLWNRVKVEAVNKPVLDAMIFSGELATYDMEPAKAVTESKPYLRLTEKPQAVILPISRKDIA